MEKTQLVSLAQKYLDGSATEQEIRLLHEWYDAAGEDEIEMVFTRQEYESGEDIKKRVLTGLQRAIRPVKIMKWVAAASVLGVITFGAATWLSLRHSTDKQVARVQKTAGSGNADILPGGNKARLMLEDSSVIVLDETNDGIIKKEEGIEISKEKGLITYRAPHGTGNHGEGPVNTLVTPRGGQYQLVLPDGTKVWLNASSSLKFPTSFSGKERKVVLTGEAYFEVAKNAAMPFEVAVRDMRVEVLGTHFNIMSYADEDAMNTTLLEGSVKVREGAVSNLLRPGEQASLNRTTKKISVSNVDTDRTIAWKNGLFLFEGATIESVMRQIARWYDVEVVYKGTYSKHFRGMISRNVNISQALKMLELTSETHFKIDGKTITVTP